MRESNYEQTKRAAQQRFLAHDQRSMMEKFGLRADADFLYVRFVARDYRIGRADGVTEWSDDGFCTAREAGFDETLTLFDVLCCAKEGCRLSGRFAAARGGAVSEPGSGLFRDEARFLDEHAALLPEALARLGGVPETVGDVAARLPLFEFLPVILQLWRADDEFSADLRFLWDENILDYMRFETTFYAAAHLLVRLREELAALEQAEPAPV